jgi:hypothetical protein
MAYVRTLSFHVERSQPLSDLFGNKEGVVILTSERPLEATVSLMTCRGLAHVETVRLDTTPIRIRYDPPWGLDWVVLQIQATTPLDTAEAPYEVKLCFSPEKSTGTKIERPLRA